jgi:peptide/nickel transport system permease protein
MLRLLSRRVAASVVTLIIGSILVFAATDALPGDTAQAILGQSANPQALAVLRHELHLDRPLTVRYLDWAGGVLHGDLGTSSETRRSVWELVAPRLENSIILAVVAAGFAVPLAILLGVIAGAKTGGVLDGSISAAALALLSLPEFVFGVLLALLFGVVWRLLPPTSLFLSQDSVSQHIKELILPALAASGVIAGYIMRMTRASTIDVLESEYIEAARLRGLPTMRRLVGHVLPNALIPVVNVIGSNLAWMFSGLVIVESVFAYPGIGSLLVQAVGSEDEPVVVAVALMIITAFLVINLAADLVLLVLNPKLRLSLR